MKFNKKTPFLAFGLLVFAAILLFAFCSCAKNNSLAGINYGDILNEAAAETQAPSQLVEVMTGAQSQLAPQEEATVQEIPKTEIEKAVSDAPEPTQITEGETTAETQAQTTPEDLFVITQSGKKYHLQSCYMVKSTKQYLTKEEAEQSKYEPCKICKPE